MLSSATFCAALFILRARFVDQEIASAAAEMPVEVDVLIDTVDYISSYFLTVPMIVGGLGLLCVVGALVAGNIR